MIERQNRPSHYPSPKTRTEAQAGSNVPPGAERIGLRHAEWRVISEGIAIFLYGPGTKRRRPYAQARHTLPLA